MWSRQNLLIPASRYTFPLRFPHPNPIKIGNPAPTHYQNFRFSLLFLARISSIPPKTAKSRILPNLLWNLSARGRPLGKQTPPFSSLISQVGSKTDQDGNLPQQSPLMFNKNKNVQITGSLSFCNFQTLSDCSSVINSLSRRCMFMAILIGLHFYI